jgi:hypothetical protein
MPAWTCRFGRAGSAGVEEFSILACQFQISFEFWSLDFEF